MSRRGEVLVTIVNDKLDFETIRSECWYRIPVASQEKWLKDRWPPEAIALYLTKKFGDESYRVTYFANVVDIHERYRWELIPGNSGHPHNQWRYHQLILGPLQTLPKPIVSLRMRRLVFIPTTWERFLGAEEINDLYIESALEDRLWKELVRIQVPAERQESVRLKVSTDSTQPDRWQYKDYFLDFAVYCEKGKINIETDGSYWHDNPERAKIDRLRDNALETAGWKILRFADHEIREQMGEYCLPTIVLNINRLGGVDDARTGGRKISLSSPGSFQPSLFDI